MGYSGKCVRNSFALLTDHRKAYAGVSIFVKSLQGALPAVFIVIMREMIGRIQRQEDFRVILADILCLAGLHMLGAVSAMLYSRYDSRFRMDFIKMTGLRMMEKAHNLSMSDFEDPETYAVIRRAGDQDGEAVLVCGEMVFESLRRGISIAGMAWILLGFDWRAAAVMLVSVMGRGAVSYAAVKRTRGALKDPEKLRRQGRYIRSLMMTGRSYKEIKALGIGPYLSDRYEDVQNERISRTETIRRELILPGLCLGILDWASAGGVWLYLLYSGYAGRILPGDMIIYIGCAAGIVGLAKGSLSGMRRFCENAGGVDAVYEYLNLPETEEINREEVKAVRSIEFSNVSFRYGNGRYALKNVSFTIRQGESAAFLGEDGAGKSTLIKLLLGLYDEYDGEIYINDTNLRELSAGSCRERISAVFGDSIRYEASLRENALLGDMSRLHNDKELRRVLGAVGLGYRVESSEGLDTVIGDCPGGQQFSEGEWRRLAVGRALLKDADVYIFDEPEGMAEIFRQEKLARLLKKEKERKIIICASRRLGAAGGLAGLADKVMILREGMINEV